MRKLFFIESNHQTHYHLEVYFEEVHQHTGGKWLVNGTINVNHSSSVSLVHSCNILPESWDRNLQEIWGQDTILMIIRAHGIVAI